MTCQPDDPTVSCSLRRQAVVAGRFKHIWGHGWVWRDAINPMWTWERCPWCDGRLPDLHEHAVTRVAGYLANGWPDDGEGAE